MSNEEYFEIKKVLESFPDNDRTKERYNTSALFHKIVIMMAQGMSPQEAIINLIQVVEDTQKAFEYQLLTAPPAPFKFQGKEYVFKG